MNPERVMAILEQAEMVIDNSLEVSELRGIENNLTIALELLSNLVADAHAEVLSSLPKKFSFTF